MLWAIIWIIGVVLVFYLINKYQNRYQSFQGGLFNLIVIGLLLFFVFTAAYVYLTTKSNFGSFGEVVSFAKIYFSWLGNFMTGTKNVVGYVVEQDWGVNSTNLTR